ncbi:MAG: hypothetical protein PSN34_06365 [Urechidicola sp.]|nr:hypothetical protein [Urechidicola sp.]
MKTFYLKLQEKLFSQEAKDMLTAINLKAVKTVDFYKSQYLVQEAFEVLALPAVLMEYSIDYGNNTQPGTASISMHCCFEQVRSTGGPKQVTEEALQFLDFVKVVNTLAKTIETEVTGKLELTNEQTSKNDTVIYVVILTYSTSYTGMTEDVTDKYNYTEDDNEIETDTGLVEEIIEAPVEAPTYDFN